MAENKVNFGLKNVYYATISGTGYGTPKAIEGAVSLSLSPVGDQTKFYADNIIYYICENNNGYSGDLEIARVKDDLFVDIYGEAQDSTSKVITESEDDAHVNVALLFQIEGDDSEELHVLYNVHFGKPAISGNTKEESTSPATATIPVEALPNARGHIRAKTGSDTDATTKTNWFTSVYETTN